MAKGPRGSRKVFFKGEITFLYVGEKDSVESVNIEVAEEQFAG